MGYPHILVETYCTYSILMYMNKLIQKAQEKKVKRKKFTKEEMELALTYIKGGLTVTQVCHALGINNRNNTSTVYQFVAQALRQFYSK